MASGRPLPEPEFWLRDSEESANIESPVRLAGGDEVEGGRDLGPYTLQVPETSPDQLMAP